MNLDKWTIYIVLVECMKVERLKRLNKKIGVDIDKKLYEDMLRDKIHELVGLMIISEDMFIIFSKLIVAEDLLEIQIAEIEERVKRIESLLKAV